MKTAWIYTAYCPETLPKPSENTLIIGVDAGCDYLLQNLMIPDFAVGDFDSASPDILKKLTEKTEIRKSIPEKDKSDTELAIDLCQELGCTTIRIFNTLQGRADHAYGIYANLIYAHRIGLQAEIFTGNGIIRIVDKELKLENKPGTIVSIYALQETARGITLEGFKYPLTNAVLSITQCLGLSNVVENVPATIKVKEGILLVFIENS